jgi:hypothetical protein
VTVQQTTEPVVGVDGYRIVGDPGRLVDLPTPREVIAADAVEDYLRSRDLDVADFLEWRAAS